MNNACLLYGRDTAGTQQWLISLWSDNVIYVGDGSHDLHLRGYTTYCDNSNEFRANNAIHAVGSNAMLSFDDRTGGFTWGWYGTRSVAILYSSADGDRVRIDRGGNISTGGIFTAWDVHCSSGLFVNGLLFTNNGGWWWTGSPIHTDSDIQCNSLYFGGCRIYNSGGYAYFDQTVHAAGVYSRGDIWNAGNINAGNQVNGAYIHSTGDARCDGSYTCGGWYYGGGNGGAQIRCWAGDWGAMSFAMSAGYFEVSADQGQSGFVLQPVTSWSDARLKLNIRDSEIDALAMIRAIPVRRL